MGGFDEDLLDGGDDDVVLVEEAGEGFGDAPGPDDPEDPAAGGVGGYFDSYGLPEGIAVPEAFGGWSVVDTVSGDPSDDAVYWLYQGAGTGTCGATSVAMALADIIDMPLGSNQEVVNTALQYDLIDYDPSNPNWQAWGGWSGMSADQVEALFEVYGVSATQYTGTVQNLADMLEAGQSIVAFVDSSELQQGIDDDATSVRQDHFVEVVGVDLVNGLVYVNDSAITNGAGFAVSLSVFEDAWADSGSHMIVTDSTTEADEQATPQPQVEPVVEPLTFETIPAYDQSVVRPGQPGFTVLPFTLEYQAGVWLEPPA
jgi:uncharacterized protein YvpB